MKPCRSLLPLKCCYHPPLLQLQPTRAYQSAAPNQYRTTSPSCLEDCRVGALHHPKVEDCQSLPLLWRTVECRLTPKPVALGVTTLPETPWTPSSCCLRRRRKKYLRSEEVLLWLRLLWRGVFMEGRNHRSLLLVAIIRKRTKHHGGEKKNGTGVKPSIFSLLPLLGRSPSREAC